MGITKNAAIRVDRLLVTLEVVSGWRGDDGCIAVIASLAHRDDTLTVAWPLGKGGLRSQLLEDLMLECDQLITLAVEHTVGVQEVLPLA